MKNKLLIVLLTAFLGFQNSFATGRGGAAATPNYLMANTDGFLGKDTASRPSRGYSNSMAPDMGEILGLQEEKYSSSAGNKVVRKIGGPATFAPSEVENMLNRVLLGLRRLRMEDYKTFRKYFEDKE